MKTPSQGFPFSSRLLHWVMAMLILAMLLIGIAMVATVSSRYLTLVSWHRPIGIAILVLAVIRLGNRFLNPAPKLPASMAPMQRFAAMASQWLLYGLMFAMPLVGWGMLSAAGYPIVVFGKLQLPPIFPHDPYLFAWLREAHTIGAFLFFAVVLLHIAAALFHGLIRRDGVLSSMTTGRTSAQS